jgi:AraC-like DNA-binding protein/adenylate kinase family enzyme
LYTEFTGGNDLTNWVEKLNNALKYIDDNLYLEIDYNELSRIAMCPVDVLQRFFVLNAGITLTEYIRRRKLYEALIEIKTTNVKIIDAAIKYGYNSSDTFSAAFRQIYGVAPSQARKKYFKIQPFPRMKFSLNISFLQGGNYMEPTKELPLFIINGANGVGKTTVMDCLFQKQKDYIVIDTTFLINAANHTPEDDFKTYNDICLFLAATVQQIGIPVVLVGCAVPGRYEASGCSKYFTHINYFTLLTDEKTLVARLRKRRQEANFSDLFGQSEDDFSKGAVGHNKWLIENCKEHTATMGYLEYTDITKEEAAVIIDKWILERIV